ncbi:MAG: hypothetical protein HZB70_01760 [Candidatus Berkelbacteria bacterium]|nr:MAG: hypothetical protein HZB70_01760 [Candidatus Berkelbacteria bacterium]QQG51946.1 MAG: hypothetical protein HY845_01235 [Candidatus Berkelbacteria bacterium]
MEAPKPHSNFVRYLFFLCGIVATLAYRSIVIISDRELVQLTWYIGTIGFIIYFLHRYQISQTRARLIVENDLEKKIESLDLTETDKGSLRYIFGTLRSTKEKWNSVVIFASSFVALLLGLYLDFWR